MCCVRVQCPSFLRIRCPCYWCSLTCHAGAVPGYFLFTIFRFRITGSLSPASILWFNYSFSALYSILSWGVLSLFMYTRWALVTPGPYNRHTKAIRPSPRARDRLRLSLSSLSSPFLTAAGTTLMLNVFFILLDVHHSY